MISIQQHGTKVQFQVEVNLTDGKALIAYWECGSEWYAELLSAHLITNMWTRIEGIRKDEYNAGWEDAKSHKKPKRDWFKSSLTRGV